MIITAYRQPSEIIINAERDTCEMFSSVDNITHRSVNRRIALSSVERVKVCRYCHYAWYLGIRSEVTKCKQTLRCSSISFVRNTIRFVSYSKMGKVTRDVVVSDTSIDEQRKTVREEQKTRTKKKKRKRDLTDLHQRLFKSKKVSICASVIILIMF